MSTTARTMTINFNNLRAQTAYALDDLTKKLNAAIIKNDGQYAVPNQMHHTQQVDLKGYVLIDAEDIQKNLTDLRMRIMVIASLFEEGDEDCKDMTEHINKNGGCCHFNEDS